ncbi:MAG: class I SAM-dependent methyltransferase [Vicinamibacteria bacterium]
MATTIRETFDVGAAEAFTGRLVGALNEGALMLMVSVGHRTRLFDAMAAAGPETSAGLAARAGLDERYVREWLGAMTAGRIVRFDRETGRYLLPAEHASVLTRGAAVNLAASAQFLPVLASVEDRVVACFEHGGGVPYSAYPRFHQVMAEESDQTVVAALEAHILPLVPGLTESLAGGIEVLDVGCGRGRALARMAAAFPRSRFTGYDLSEEAVAEGNAQAAAAGLSNLWLEVRDAAALPASGRFDLVTAFDAIHDQADPAAVLAGIRGALKAGGVFLMQDIGASRDPLRNAEHPLGAYLYAISCLHCMTVSLAQGGAGLGAVWGEETAREMLKAAGFAPIEGHRLPHDIVNVYFVARR